MMQDEYKVTVVYEVRIPASNVEEAIKCATTRIKQGYIEPRDVVVARFKKKAK